MNSSDSAQDADNLYRRGGPVVLGVPAMVTRQLVVAAAELAASLEVHLLCAFVDPASYLTEWEPRRTLVAASLDPEPNEEAAYPAADVRLQIAGILDPIGQDWSFRVLNGDVSLALTRLAQSTGASILVVGAGRDSVLSRLGRALEGSVAANLTRIQNRPVVVVPEHTGPGRPRRSRPRSSA